ncbi:MAG: alkaline phosphatase family protein [Planctomycetes bacterium]|nr:alkaline phosphatase family protein [Planctomycetota bacterium]
MQPLTRLAAANLAAFARSGLACWLLATTAPVLGSQVAPAQLTHGPVLGHCDTTSLHLWARAANPGRYTLHLQDVVTGTGTACSAEATAAADNTLHFTARNLKAATAYDYWITCGEIIAHARGARPLVTAMTDDSRTATIAFGSCANDVTYPEQPIWGQILARAPQALVLLGDTPYIDDGSTAGRRRRYCDFLDFPPVRATLAAIPTWFTWDDHDYARNDQFGAAPGSDTARAAFVEYHAHATYGDGQRGIYTGFRRGPVEVFLLDTRTFADTETSVLAAGERSLLGKAQTEWLLRRLEASTATFRVLACGMVWNGGVRPGKKDCWGNWSAERDALFRWLGARRISGVVLVSGDVHRSRVILHPTRELAGYDLPEFVTSPLAQNVLESNAVPTPGLAFDHGEAHSCLVLTAVTSTAAATLRATFVAGAGEEFHVREFPLTTLSRPDAAASYRRIAEQMRTIFGEDLAGVPEAEPDDPSMGIAPTSAVQPAWRQAVAAAAPLFVEWATAAADERCRFARRGREPEVPEFFELLPSLMHLTRLAMARGYQAGADAAPTPMPETIRALLTLARHARQDPTGVAWSFAAGTEQNAAALLSEVTTRLDSATIATLREEIAAHLTRRGSLGGFAAAMRMETWHLFELSLRAMQLGANAEASVARRFEAEVRRQFAEQVEPLLTACDGMADQPTAAQRAGLEQAIADFRTRHAARRQALAALRDGSADPAPPAAAAADLAILLAGMCLPDLVTGIDEQTAALATLMALAR